MTTATGHFTAYAAIVTANDPPASAYCMAPNPSNGLTKSRRTFSKNSSRNAFAFSAATPRNRIRPVRILGSDRRPEVVESMDPAHTTPDFGVYSGEAAQRRIGSQAQSGAAPL